MFPAEAAVQAKGTSIQIAIPKHIPPSRFIVREATLTTPQYVGVKPTLGFSIPPPEEEETGNQSHPTGVRSVPLRAKEDPTLLVTTGRTTSRSIGSSRRLGNRRLFQLASRLRKSCEGPGANPTCRQPP